MKQKIDSKELIEKFHEAKIAYYNRPRGYVDMRHASTAVYIPKALIEEEKQAHRDFFSEMSESYQKNSFFGPELTDEQARSRIKDFINLHWAHTYTVSEYSLYRNSITGEVKKFLTRFSRKFK